MKSETSSYFLPFDELGPIGDGFDSAGLGATPFSGPPFGGSGALDSVLEGSALDPSADFGSPPALFSGVAASARSDFLSPGFGWRYCTMTEMRRLEALSGSSGWRSCRSAYPRTWPTCAGRSPLASISFRAELARSAESSQLE